MSTIIPATGFEMRMQMTWESIVEYLKDKRKEGVKPVQVLLHEHDWRDVLGSINDSGELEPGESLIIGNCLVSIHPSVAKGSIMLAYELTKH